MKKESCRKSKEFNLKLVHKYFSDLRKWIITVVSLFAVAYMIVIHSKIEFGKYTIIPACFFLVFILNIRYFLLWIKAIKDVRKEDIIEKDIIINRIHLDKHFTFHNNGGAPVGYMHFTLEDTNDNCYRLCGKKWLFVSDDGFAGVHIRVQYLNTSRIVLRMMELQTNKKERNAQYAAVEFRRGLSDYFEINNKRR